MDAIFEKIDELVKKSEHKAPKTRKKKILLYAEGLKAKLKQVDYALTCLEQFDNRTDATESTTEEKSPSISMQVSFYCDIFWTFLYSSLDVLSQIVNQAMALDLYEKDVSFNKVKCKLGGNAFKSTKIYRQYDKCFRSTAFKNLEKYRNCSIHRRQIYIEETSTRVRRTPGYSTSTIDDSSTTVSRILCKDPLKSTPAIDPKRIIPDYMIENKKKVVKRILGIIKAIEIV